MSFFCVGVLALVVGSPGLTFFSPTNGFPQPFWKNLGSVSLTASQRCWLTTPHTKARSTSAASTDVIGGVPTRFSSQFDLPLKSTRLRHARRSLHVPRRPGAFGWARRDHGVVLLQSGRGCSDGGEPPFIGGPPPLSLLPPPLSFPLIPYAHTHHATSTSTTLIPTFTSPPPPHPPPTSPQRPPLSPPQTPNPSLTTPTSCHRRRAAALFIHVRCRLGGLGV